MKCVTKIVIVLVLGAAAAFAAGPFQGGRRQHWFQATNLGQTLNGINQNPQVVTLPPVARPPAMRPH